jgi:hypothetical protein
MAGALCIISFLLMLVALAAFLLGLIKPSLVIRWGAVEQRTRGRVCLVYGLSALVLFIVAIVAAGNAPSGTNSSSAQKSVQSTAAQAPAPTDLVGSASGLNVSLSWTGSSDASSYIVERSPDGTNWAQSAPISQTSYADAAPSWATKYYYRVVARSATDALSVASNAVQVSTGTMPVPTSLTGSASGVNVSLSWTGCPGASFYIVERSTDGTNWAQSAPVSQTSYIDVAPQWATKYYYRIEANATGAFSSMVQVTTTGPPGPSVGATPGQLRWKFLAGDMIESAPIVSNGVVYFGSNDIPSYPSPTTNALYALDANTGQVRWQFPITSKGNPEIDTPTVSGSVVYFESEDNIYALDANAGQELWEQAIDTPLGSDDSSPCR